MLICTFVHVPSEPGRLHARQPPHAAVSQHVPSMQLPDVQSPGAAQARPFGRVGLHVPSELQKAPPAQSPSFAHEGLHAVALAQASPFGHGPVNGAGQPVAAPEQVACVSCPPAHDDAHATAAADGVHAPAPLQPPAVQVAGSAAHAPCGS